MIECCVTPSGFMARRNNLCYNNDNPSGLSFGKTGKKNRRGVINIEQNQTGASIFYVGSIT